MDKLIEIVTEKLWAGGPESMIAACFVVIAALVWDRLRLLKVIERKEEQLSQKDEKLEKIIDDYHKGNITLIDAFNSLRMVLHEIKGKIS